MKNLFSVSLVIALFIVFSSCCNQEGEKNNKNTHEKSVKLTSSLGSFGEVITPEDAIMANKLPELLEGKESFEVKLIGEVATVCKMSGCWMDISLGNGEIVHVTFKDDAFVMPKDIVGKTATIEGIGSYEEIPVNMLKLIAEDEGKSQDEIDKIIEPKMEYSFIAHGVVIEDK